MGICVSAQFWNVLFCYNASKCIFLAPSVTFFIHFLSPAALSLRKKMNHISETMVGKAIVPSEQHEVVKKKIKSIQQFTGRTKIGSFFNVPMDFQIQEIFN